MDKTNLILCLSLTLVFSPAYNWASETSSDNDSNQSNFSYPDHNCGKKVKKPLKPKRIKEYDDDELYNADIAKYNIAVSDYNKTIKVYKACINRYIKNGNNDLNRIRKKLNAALKEARTN